MNFNLLFNRFFVCFFLMLFLISCRNDDISTLSRADISKSIQQRRIKGQFFPLHDSILQQNLPVHLLGYLETENKGKTFRSPYTHFSQVERLYHGRQRLSISISDYVADSSAFLKLWDQYEIRRKEYTAKTFFDKKALSFGWIFKENSREIFSLYAALDYRFWIEIRLSNLQSGISDAENRRELEAIFRLLEGKLRKNQEL